ncbi:MAG: class I SAM-dependent methyltransferase [Paraprevotella sp.]|nr:class I SAM-dependent methyltransferase [Paraprevotella sp.]
MINEKTRDFILRNRLEDVRKLALKKAPEGVDLPMALQQIEGWQTAVRKLPSWAEREGLWFPPRLAMEQCSSEQTASYKHALVKRLLHIGDTPADGTMMDLTGGFGIDFSFIAPLFTRAVYMERQPELCRIARHNFTVLHLDQAEVREGDSSNKPQEWPDAELCFIDPARRDAAGHKTVAIEDCTPDLTVLQDSIHRKARLCLIKLSPMLDIQAALRVLHGISEVHAVCVQNECKELLLVATHPLAHPVAFHCVDMEKERTTYFTFTAEEEKKADCSYAQSVGKYLYEPNAAILKCGGYRILAARYGLCKLHPNSHLYTSNLLREDFPGRTFQIENVSGFGKKEVSKMLQGTSQANLTVRNFPATVADLRKRLRLKDGGDIYLFATTLDNGEHVLLRCRKVSPTAMTRLCQQP